LDERPTLAFDVGGSFVKAGLVDVDRGHVLGATVREPTPPGATPEGVIDALAALAARLPSTGPVGMAFPSVAKGGVAYTAANVDSRWIGTDASALLGSRLGRPVVFLNDADAAGIAEIRLGAGRARSGTVLLLTLGTGIGSALFVDGRLVPNTELGHLEVGGEEAESRASAQARIARKLDWDAWIGELNVVLAEYHRLLWPDLIIVGGGITENWELFGPRLRCRAPIVRAQFGNDAGIVGAALAAVERQDA
jgi:polyphosphate glucokinase